MEASVDPRGSAAAGQADTAEPLEILRALAQQPGSHPQALAAMTALTEQIQDKGAAFGLIGAWLRTRGRAADAEYWLERSLAICPRSTGTRNELAAARMDMGRTEQACDDLARVLEEEPSLSMARCNYATCLYHLKRLPEALNNYRMVTREAPDFIYPRVQALSIARQICDWSDWDAEVEFLRSRRPTPQNDAPQMDLLYLPLSPEQLRSHAECHAAMAGQAAQTRTFANAGRRRAANQILRIGYVSDDLRDHVVGALLVEVLEQHDRKRFEIHVFDWKPPSNTIIERRIRRAGVRLHDIGAFSDEQAAARIAALGIDILVDLKGYTTAHRAGIFRRRAAPVQINWLGYPGTLGDRSLDYIIADRFVIPAELESGYTESVLRLPTVLLPNDRGRPIARASTRGIYGLPAAAFVYCYLGRSSKITPEVFDDWARILNDVPDSVLWLRTDNPKARDNLTAEAQRRGLAAGRVVFAGDEHLRTSELVARYLLADVALDTFPYGSHVTASEAIWAGCPVVTRAGSTFASRVAGSLLSASGLPELVAETRQDYCRIATALGRERQRAAQLRSYLQQTRNTNPAFDTPRFVKELESAFQLAFDRHLQGMAPASIDVPPCQVSPAAAAAGALRDLRL